MRNAYARAVTRHLGGRVQAGRTGPRVLGLQASQTRGIFCSRRAMTADLRHSKRRNDLGSGRSTWERPSGCRGTGPVQRPNGVPNAAAVAERGVTASTDRRRSRRGCLVWRNRIRRSFKLLTANTDELCTGTSARTDMVIAALIRPGRSPKPRQLPCTSEVVDDVAACYSDRPKQGRAAHSCFCTHWCDTAEHGNASRSLAGLRHPPIDDECVGTDDTHTEKDLDGPIVAVRINATGKVMGDESVSIRSLSALAT